MAFRFALESVLRLRVSLERQEQTRLELAARLMYGAMERCTSLEQERQKLEAKFQASITAGVESSEIHLYLSARSGIECARIQAERALEDKRKQWNDQRLKFLRARRDREVIASIRARQHAAFIAEQGRREQQQIDDLFAMRLLQQNGQSCPSSTRQTLPDGKPNQFRPIGKAD